jgi:hypothetical protein
VRSLVYNFEQFEAALNLLPAVNPPKVIALLNSETAGVGDDFAGWATIVAKFAEQFEGRVAAVERLNECRRARTAQDSRRIAQCRATAPRRRRSALHGRWTRVSWWSMQRWASWIPLT